MLTRYGLLLADSQLAKAVRCSLRHYSDDTHIPTNHLYQDERGLEGVVCLPKDQSADPHVQGVSAL